MDELEALRQRVQQLEAAAREHERLKKLIDAAANDEIGDRTQDDIMLYVDETSGRVVDANPAALQFLGMTLDTLRGLPLSDLELVDADSSAQAARPITSFHGLVVYRATYGCQDGSQRPVKVHKRLTEKDNQRLLCYLLEDMSLPQRLWTELYRREQTGYHFQHKLKLLNQMTFELSPLDDFDGLCWHSIKLGMERLGFERLSIWFYNRQTNRMVGSYGVDEQGQIRDERDQSWPFGGTHIIEFLNGITEPVVTRTEAPLYNEKSEVMSYGWHISVPMLNGSDFIGFMAADNFLSQRPMHDYEPELLRLYGSTIGHLAGLLRARRQALELQLEQKHVLMLQTFIRDIGHDFKTPLTIITTNAYLISRTKDDERHKRLVSGIHQQADYITQTVNDMLDVVHLEYTLRLDLTPVNLNALMTAVFQNYRSLAAAKQIQWHLEDNCPAILRADVHYLQQAISHLVKNAFQHTPSGGRVTLRLDCDETRVMIAIQDSGIGIAAQHLEKIFNPLYRVDEARTDRGSGLGLFIAKTIVEAHRGRITVESVFGAGSTFAIVLPRSETAIP